MLHKRVLSSLLGIPVLLGAVWYGGPAQFILSLLIMVVSLLELNKILVKVNLKPSVPSMITGIAALGAGALFGGAHGLGLAVAPVVVLVLLEGVARYPDKTPGDILAGLGGIFYIGLFIYFYLIRTLDGGLAWVLTLLLGTWASDIAAYVVGKKLGKRKLAPTLSPGKTVAGALGGIAGGALGALSVNLLYPVAPQYVAVVLGLTIGLFGLFGDLFESSLKRTAGIKDTGKAIPGHGGFLDRFDSMIFASPAVYYFIILYTDRWGI